MKTIEKTKKYAASVEQVFDCLDDLGVTGMHMTQSSMPMMGGKMNVEFLTPYKNGWHAEYRWTGKVLWMTLDFIVLVTRWVRGREKSWETIGTANMIIMSWFKMDLFVEGGQLETTAHVSISYKKPSGFFNRFLSFLLADWYCKWCLKSMLNDTEKKLGSKEVILKTS